MAQSLHVRVMIGGFWYVEDRVYIPLDRSKTVAGCVRNALTRILSEVKVDVVHTESSAPKLGQFQSLPHVSR